MGDGEVVSIVSMQRLVPRLLHHLQSSAAPLTHHHKTRLQSDRAATAKVSIAGKSAEEGRWRLVACSAGALLALTASARACAHTPAHSRRAHIGGVRSAPVPFSLACRTPHSISALSLPERRQYGQSGQRALAARRSLITREQLQRRWAAESRECRTRGVCSRTESATGESHTHVALCPCDISTPRARAHE